MSGLSQPFRLGPDGEVNHLEVSEEPQTKQYVIYWGDIRKVYRKALHVKNGPMIVNLARNQQGQCCEPDCIKHYPGVTLEVVEGEDTAAQPSPTPAATLLGTANTAAFYTHNNPLATAKIADPSQPISVESIDPLIASLAIHAPVTNTTSLTATKNTALVSGWPASHRLLQRTQSLLQESSAQLVHCENSLQAGQIVQANAIMHGMQAMRKDIQEEFRFLHSEVAKSEEMKELKQLVQDIKATADVQTKRIIELQELSVKMQREALDRLAFIQTKIAVIMTQSYELHEYPIPRLFIVLPKEGTTRTEMITRGIKNVFTKQFKLYFLCECGDHTKPVDGKVTNPNLRHEIHIARHEGYDIDRPTEFFDKYGSYILTLLQMLKYGVAITGVVVPPLGQLKIVDSLGDVAEGIDRVLKDIDSSIDSSIAYIEGLKGAQSQPPSSEQNLSANSSTLGGPEALEGADLRQLDSFLKTKDGGRVLGNLYRIVTAEGHVKWVCLDHYRENYRAKAAQDLRDAVQEIDGEYNEITGRLVVELSIPIAARRFYSVLISSRSVQELDFSFRWSPSMQDLRDLRDAIKATNIRHVRLDANYSDAPLSDLLNSGRRSDPILQMLSGGNIQTLHLDRWVGFMDRISNMPNTLHVRHLRIHYSGAWSKKLPRLIDSLRASPLLSEVTFRSDTLSSILDPVVAALDTCGRAQGLKLTVESPDSKAVVEFEAQTSRILYVDLRVNGEEKTKLLHHPLVRHLYLCNTPDLPALLVKVQSCLKDNTGLESVSADCHFPEFFKWFEAFRDLFANHPHQTSRFVLYKNRTSYIYKRNKTYAPHTGCMLKINNIQESNAAEVILDSTTSSEMASGYLDTFPDRWIIKVGVHVINALTPSSSIEYLQQLQARRSEHLLVATLKLNIFYILSRPLSFKCLEALEQYLAIKNPEVHIDLFEYHPHDTIDRLMTRSQRKSISIDHNVSRNLRRLGANHSVD